MQFGSTSPVQSQTIGSKTETKSQASLIPRPKMGRPSRLPKFERPNRELLPDYAGVSKATNPSRQKNKQRQDIQPLYSAALESAPEQSGPREDNTHVTAVHQARPRGLPIKNNESVFRPPTSNNLLLEVPPFLRRENDSPVPGPAVLPTTLNLPDGLGSVDGASPATRPAAAPHSGYTIEIVLPFHQGTRQVGGNIHPESKTTLVSQSFVQSLGMMEKDQPCTQHTPNTLIESPRIVELIVILRTPERKKMVKSASAVVLPDAYFRNSEHGLILGQDHHSDMTYTPLTFEGTSGGGGSGPAQWPMSGASNPLTFPAGMDMGLHGPDPSGVPKTHGAMDSAAVGESYLYGFDMRFPADGPFLMLCPDDFD